MCPTSFSSANCWSIFLSRVFPDDARKILLQAEMRAQSPPRTTCLYEWWFVEWFFQWLSLSSRGADVRTSETQFLINVVKLSLMIDNKTRNSSQHPTAGPAACVQADGSLVMAVSLVLLQRREKRRGLLEPLILRVGSVTSGSCQPGWGKEVAYRHIVTPSTPTGSPGGCICPGWGPALTRDSS